MLLLELWPYESELWPLAILSLLLHVLRVNLNAEAHQSYLAVLVYVMWLRLRLLYANSWTGELSDACGSGILTVY